MIHRQLTDIDTRRLSNLNLKLRLPPESNSFGVFIRDPKNKQQYRHKHFTLLDPYQVEFNTKDMKEYDTIPCPEEDLEGALKKLIGCQEKYPPASRVVFATAEYVGPDKLSLRDIIRLVGINCCELRRTYLNSIN